MESMPAWYGEGSFEDVHGDVKLALQILYVNLLNAELRFKRCESHDIGSASQEFQDEASRLAFLVPNLLQFVSAMSRSHVTFDESRFLELSTRCYWLASLYYFWWGRCCTDSSVANAADEFGMEYLSNALRSLSQCSPVITPHLGDQWSILSFDLLSKYQQKIQSSSVVTKARQSFHDIQHYVEERPETDKNKIALSEDVKVMLASLGAKLLERYSIGDENFDDKLDELLNDFILVHQDHLLEVQVKSHSFLETSSTYDWGESCWGTTWISVPSNKVASILNITSKETSRPSIMKVLSTSLLASEENVSSVFSIYAQIVLRALELRAQALQNGVNDGQQIDIDDFFQQSVTSRDGDSSEPPKAERSGKEYLLMITAIFFIDKLKDLVISYACSTDMQNIIKEFSSGDMLCRIICNSLNSSKSPHFSSSVPIFRSISKLVSAFNAQQVLTKQTARVYFVCLVKVFTYQRKDFGYMLGSVIDKRLKKWQLHLNAKADFISFVASEIADLMSLHPSRVNPDGELEVSHLVKGIIGLSEEESPCLISATITPFAQFTEALIWFWKICSNDPSSPENSRLLVPISSSIIALCGSPGISVECDLAKSLLEPNGKNVKINVSFSDYFDSEDSINGTFLSDEDTNDHEDGYNGRRVILRKFNQLVQCISVVFSSINEKIACQEYQNQSSEHGPILPLVAVRTLSNMSDEIFMLFSDEKGVWSEQYPYGARSCGNMLDNVLCKSYRCIYGFNIVGQNPNTVDSSKFKAFIPESTTAAAQLFRCIRRLFHNNRRAPPTKALEAVAAALPPAEETDVSKAIRKFLFSAEKNCDLSRLNTPSAPRDFPEWVLSQVDTLNLSRKIDRNDLQIIRKGICHELAKGSIMKLDGQNLSSSDQGLSEETELTKSHELSLNKKFCAVLDDLCYNPENIEGWIVLSECLGFKADIICDRLVPIKEPYNSADFCLTPESKRKSLSTMTLDQLKKSQQDEFEESRKNWTPFIGEDLYVFMHYPWSTFSSLQACAKDIGSKLSKETANLEGCDTNTEYSCWKEIESKFERENYLEWVNAWAGMFVTALRTMRMRALLVARFLAKSKQGAMHPSEVSEDIGTALYSDLMASTVYGYPMHCMTRHEKRQIALCSKSYFKEAIQLSESDEYSCDSQTISWEVQFMVGKVCLNIAYDLICPKLVPHITLLLCSVAISVTKKSLQH